MLLVGKLCSLIILCIDLNCMFNEVIYNFDVNKGYDMVKDSGLYRLSQHVPLGEKNISKINKAMEQISDKDIFTYITYADDEYYSSEELKYILKKGKKFNINNSITCSNNMLSKLNVKDSTGKKISTITLKKDQTKYLVPEKYKNKIDEIKIYYGCNDEDIDYIQNNQYFMSYTIVGEYWVDAIICVCNVEKVLSQNTLLTSKGKDKMEQLLQNMQFHGDNIGITSLEDINREMKDASNVELTYIYVNLIISVMSYIVTTISIIIIYFELKKKLFGVYTLVGKVPLFEIIYFLIINICIVSIIAITINSKLLVINITEVLIYITITSKYLKNKAILAIKGE